MPVPLLEGCVVGCWRQDRFELGPSANSGETGPCGIVHDYGIFDRPATKEVREHGLGFVVEGGVAGRDEDPPAVPASNRATSSWEGRHPGQPS